MQLVYNKKILIGFAILGVLGVLYLSKEHTSFAQDCGIDPDCWLDSAEGEIDLLPDTPADVSPSPDTSGTGSGDSPSPSDDVILLPDLDDVDISSPPDTGSTRGGSGGTSGTPESGGGSVRFENPLRFNSIVDVIESIATYLVYIGMPLVVLMILVGAYYIITGGGSQERVAKGKRFILYAAIGFVIIIGAKGIVGFIKGALGID